EEASLPGQDEVVFFEELYRSHGARMKSVAYNILGNPSDAEDAVQEAFLRAYRGIAAFKGTAQGSTWMYRILVNACHDMGRQRRREWESPELWPRIQAALAAEAARIERRRAPSRVSAWLTLAAAAAVLVFGITVVLRGRAPQAGAPPAEAERRLLTDRALREVERTEGD